MDRWAEGRLAGRCAAVVPVQVPLRCQQATGVGVGGRGGRGGRSGSYGSALWTDYGLRSVSTGCRRCRVGRVWQSERRSGRRAAGRRCARMSSGQGERASVEGREGSSGVVSLLCVREEGKVPVPVLCLEGALSYGTGYERTATGSCREPEPEPDLRPHSARPRPRPRRRSRAPRWPRERAAAAASIHLASPHQRPYLHHHHQCKHHHQRKHQQHRQRKHQQHRQRKHHHHHHHHTAAPTMATETPLPIEAAALDAPPQPEPAADTAPKPAKRSWR